MTRIRYRTPPHRKVLLLLGIMVLAGMFWTIYERSSSSVEVNWLPYLAKPSTSPYKSTSASQETSHRYKIVIDAGHGGKDPGATGASGNREQLYTLALAKKVAQFLQQEPLFEVHLTRTDNTSVPLEDRAQIGNDLHADAFISIHGNTYSDPSVSGTETYYYSNDSLAFARKVHEQLAVATGFHDRGVKKEGWKVLKLSSNLAILLEIGFLTNQDEERNMLSEVSQTRTAQAIVKGINMYFEASKG